MVKLAVVAGGEGTRLRSVAGETPKCLTPVGGTPILAHQLNLARRYQVTEVFLLTGRGSSQIEAFCADGSQHGMRIRVFREPHPLGTAGGFKHLGANWDGTLLVFYGDLLCNVDLDRLVGFHRERGGVGTLFAHPNDHPFDSDLLKTDPDDHIRAIHRKPHLADAHLGNLVNGAVYALEPDIVTAIPEGKCDWAHDVFPRALDMGIALFAYRSSEYLRDIGTPERLRQAECDWSRGRVERGSYASKRSAVVVDFQQYRGQTDETVLVPEPLLETLGRINASRFLAVLLVHAPASVAPELETVLARKRVFADVIYYREAGHDSSPEWERSFIQQHNLDPSESVIVQGASGEVRPLLDGSAISCVEEVRSFVELLRR